MSMAVSMQVFFCEELGPNLFIASLSTVMLSVLIRNVLKNPASHFKVQMTVSQVWVWNYSPVGICC